MKTKIFAFFTKLRAAYVRFKVMTPEQFAYRVNAFLLVLFMEIHRIRKERRARKLLKRARRAAASTTPTK